MNTSAMPAGAGNPSLNGMVMKETMLATEAAAQRADEHGDRADLGDRQSVGEECPRLSTPATSSCRA